MDRNKAVLDYLLTCEPIKNSALYFNFANIKDAATQFITSATDVNINTPYIDGTVLKRYSLTVISYLSISDNPIAKVEGFSNENISDMLEIQTLLDWIEQQERIQNYPDFGEGYKVESIKTTSNEPRLDQIDATKNPPLAKYSFTIQIDYLDYTNIIWTRR